jgi:hypothetical protein
MKIRFSLSTLFICTTMLAIVTAICVVAPVKYIDAWEEPKFPLSEYTLILHHDIAYRSPDGSEIARRLVYAWPSAILAVFIARYGLRWMKQYRVAKNSSCQI